MIKQKIATFLEGAQQYLPAPLYQFWQLYVPNLKRRHFSLPETLRRYLRNRRLQFTVFTLPRMRKGKKSDTLFILGCNESVNTIPDSVWPKIKAFDSLGLNYWIYHSFVPDYYLLEYGNDKTISRYHSQLIQRRAADYRDTIFLLHSYARRKGMCPRLMPEFYPARAKVGYFLYPKIVRCPVERPFRASDFRKSILYRGTLNLALHFAYIMGFKNIVLTGCEMNSDLTFYEHYPEARWMHETDGYLQKREERQSLKYQGAYVMKGKHTVIETVLAINEFVFRPQGIRLMVFNKKSLLYPQIPLFEF